MVGGRPWISYATALGNGFSTSNPTFSAPPRSWSPTVDSDTNTMLGTGIWCSSCNVNFSQTLPNGSYNIYVWMVEDYQSNFRSSNLFLQGVQVATGIGRMPLNTWQRYGPYPVTVTNSVLTAMLARVAGDPSVEGIEVWVTGTPTPTPTPTATATPTPHPTPIVTLKVSPKNVRAGNIAVYTVTTSIANPNTPLIISYTMKGSAVSGTNYSLSGSPGQIIIPAGSKSAAVALTAISGTQTGKQATMALKSGAAYKLSSIKSKKVVTVLIKE